MRDFRRHGSTLEARDQRGTEARVSTSHVPREIDKSIRRESPDDLRFGFAYLDAGDWLRDVAGAMSAGQVFVPTPAACAEGDPVTLSLSFPGLLEPLGVDGQVAAVRRAKRRAPGGITVALSESACARLTEAQERVSARDPAWMVPAVRILVVEDNVSAAQLIEDALHLAARRAFGGRVAFHVPRAATPGDALAFLRRKPIDALITDVYLGGGTGTSVIEHLRADPALASVPVIAISAGHDLTTRRAAMTAGANRFLRKPLRIHELVRAISETLGIEQRD